MTYATIKDFLTRKFGLAIDGWTLTEGKGIPGNGLTIVRNAMNCDGDTQRWISHLAFIVIFIWLVTPAFAGDPPPNIIVILTDDQGWTGTSVQMDLQVPESRSDFYQTPNLDALAATGMRFSNAYSSSPVCSPSRASIITGKSPAQLQMTDLTNAGNMTSNRFNLFLGRPLTAPIPRISLPLEEISMSERIKQANPNYVTAHYGKWHLTFKEGIWPVNHGYDFQHRGNVDAGPENPKNIITITEFATTFMEERVTASEPFLVQVSHDAVHVPNQARPSTIEKYTHLPSGDRHDHVVYAAMTEELDTGLGLLLDKVQELGIEDNTYIIYTSDNGAKEDDSTSDPLFKGKGRLWEGGVRVPMIIKGPGIEAGSVSDVPVIGMDLFSTISELAGVTDPLPDGVEGASLVPILNNGGQLPAGMQSLQRQYAENGELFFHYPHYEAPRPFPSTVASAVRDGDFKLLKMYGENGQPDQLFLYNLADNLTESDDPLAPVNLSNAMPDKTSELHAKLKNWLQAVDASLPYDVSANVQLVWDGQQPGSDPDGWRSTIDVDYRDRETWLLNDASQGPQQVTISPHQPHLSKKAFRFDGDDGMTRKFFHVSDLAPPEIFDNNHSASFEFWLRLDSLNQDHVLFESGDGTTGLSITFGDADGNGDHDEVRFRARGVGGKELTITSEFDLFANPTRDFVQLVAVINDDENDRFAELYVNGALFGHHNGVNGPTEHIDWDGFDQAGLGRAAGSGLGGSGGSGDQPFMGDHFNGDIALFQFYNWALDADTVRDYYNAQLDAVNAGVVSTSGAAKTPPNRPSHVSEGAFEDDDSIWVIQERNDTLDQTLSVDILPVDGQTYGRGGLTQDIDGSLPAGTTFSSYLLHFDPLGEPTLTQNTLGTVSFLHPIQGILVEQGSLEQTDALLGAIGRYTTGRRAFDLTGMEFLTVSDDLHRLDVSFNAVNDQIVDIRVLTMQLIPGDFDGDGDVNIVDFGIFAGFFGEPNTIADLDGSGMVDIVDFGNFSANFNRGSSTTAIATPEPMTLVMLGLGGLLLTRRQPIG